MNSTPLGRLSLLVHGADRRGIVASVTAALTEFEANIVSLSQYSDDPDGGDFFQRIVMEIPDLPVSATALRERLSELLSGDMAMHWQLRDMSKPMRVAILASKEDHCLLDLLWRNRRGDLPIDIPMVISNHADVADDVRSFGVPFLLAPSRGADKSEAEARILELLIGNVDVVVLARYMQILSPDFIERIDVPIINIHHSFLPAFIGAAPYRKAKERGVKLVGATAHYVTSDLDEGPIIEQDVARVSHADSLRELVRLGADVERQVLARAVLWHAQDRIIRIDNRTIVL